MDRTQGAVAAAVVSLWLVLHVLQAVVGIQGNPWTVPPEVDYAMGSVIAAVLGGPKLLKMLGKNGKGETPAKEDS